MISPLLARLGQRLEAWSPLLAWALYLPLGAKYALALCGSLLAVTLLVRRQPMGKPPHPWARPWTGPMKPPSECPTWATLVHLLRQPAMPALLALLGWLTLSALWSEAPARSIVSHLWTYALPLLLPLLALAMPPPWALRWLQQFSIASSCVGSLFLAQRLGMPTESGLWASTLTASGNQRIVNSILLALGCMLALWQSTQARGKPQAQLLWCAVAVLSALGLALQDRRSGMLLLPLLAGVWILSGAKTWIRRGLALAALALACALAWSLADGVRARFDEGLRELRADTSTDLVDTSWGQRVRMVALTTELIAQRPLRGWGVASWVTQWRRRVLAGTPLHEHTTPHNEYLLLAQQAGLPALALLLAAGIALWRSALAGQSAGVPLLLCCSAFAVTGLFNAVLRDAKFSLPLILLAAAATAAASVTQRSGQSTKPSAAAPGFEAPSSKPR